MSQQSQVLKFAATVLQNFPEVSEEMMQWWIENPLKLQVVLRKLCAKPEFKCDVWKTIKLGTGPKTADDFRLALREGKFKISDWASDILGKPNFTAASEEIELDLVKVTVGELGLKQGARRDQIYERAKECGLDLCPAEVGPQLRLQYKDQLNGEWLLIAMEPTLGSDGRLGVFGVGRSDSGLWLDAYYGNPDSGWGAGCQWVFVSPRK